MASERAKELAAKQKAEAKAAKLAKKNSTDPKDWGTWKQLLESTKMVAKAKPEWRWLMIASAVVPLVVCVAAGLIWHHWIWGVLFGVLIAATVFMLVLGQLMRRLAYTQHEGEPGSAQVALSMLTSGKKSKWSYTAAITANRQGDTIHRVIGPGGLILIGDGDPARLAPMLGAERKKHEQLLYDVSVQTILAGKADGAVPIDKLAKKLEKLPKVLSQTQINEVQTRIKALDTIRGRVPLPKGPMPSLKGAHRAMRGR
jgi:hypothetical protein